MDESEWLSGRDITRMVMCLRAKRRVQTATMQRKLRLWTVACCRRVWDLLPEDGRTRIAAAEGAADGRLPAAELLALNAVWWPDQPSASGAATQASYAAVRADAFIAALHAWYSASAARHWLRDHDMPQEWAVQADLLRCVSGNPFRRPKLPSRWRTPTALAIAEAAYADHDWSRLPVLADALEDAGCDAADLLAHLRGPGPHARGCWPVDLVLGKS